MTNEDTTDFIDTHPAVLAAKQSALREHVLKQADRLPPKVKGEVSILRKIADSTHKALCDYDKTEAPPNVSGTLATTYDMIVARLDQLSREYEAKSGV